MGRLVIQQNLITLGFEGTFSVLISFIRVCELKKSNKTTKYFLSDAYSSGFVFQLILNTEYSKEEVVLDQSN